MGEPFGDEMFGTSDHEPTESSGEEGAEAKPEEAELEEAEPEESGDEQPVAGDVDEEEDSPPDVLDRLSGLFGVDTGDVRVSGQNAMGHGATAIGQITIHGSYQADSGAWLQQLPATTVEDVRAGYARAPSDDLLWQQVMKQPLVRLAGRAGTGRYSAAVLALAERYGDERVVLVVSVDRLPKLVGARSPLKRGHGYVLPLEENSRLDGWEAAGLEARIKDLDATIVLIEGPGKDYHEFPGQVLHHQPAAASAVFRAQLRYLLADGTPGRDDSFAVPADVDRYVDEVCARPELRGYLTGSPPQSEVVSLARTIAKEAPCGEVLGELLRRRLPDQLRRRAAEILNPAREEQDSAVGDVDYLRALRLSCAVLNNHPLADIESAALRLAGPVGDAASTRSLRRPELGSLLGPIMRQAVAEVRDPLTGARTVRFAPGHEHLVTNLLDVAWTDWGNPERLMQWLADLARDANPAVRRSASGVIGWVAGRDFAIAVRTVEQLGREPRNGFRLAAGVAVVSMAMQQDLQRRLRNQLNEWVAGNAYLRDTVARAYALGLSRLWPSTAMADLRSIAKDRFQRRYHSVARAVEQLYLAGHAERVIGDLVAWHRDGPGTVRLHAARTLLRLAKNQAQPPRAHWPILLDQVRAGSVPMRDVADLWALTLSLPGTAYRGWRSLGYWLERVDDDPDAAEVYGELLTVLAASPPLRRRLNHQIRHVWQSIMPHSHLLPSIRRRFAEV